MKKIALVIAFTLVGNAYAAPTDDDRKMCRKYSNDVARLIIKFEQNKADFSKISVDRQRYNSRPDVLDRVANHMVWAKAQSPSLSAGELATLGNVHCLAQF